MAETRVGHVVFDRAIAANRDFIASGPFPPQNLLVGVHVPVAVLVDENEPSGLPAAIVGARAPVARLADIDAIALLDGFAARKLERVNHKVSVVGQLLRGDPIAIRWRHDRKKESKNNEPQHELDK